LKSVVPGFAVPQESIHFHCLQLPELPRNLLVIAAIIWFDAAGIACAAADHGVGKSLYFANPDGNRIELHVDQSDAWKRDPAAVASYKPLTL
jgi:catechol-2,3-dioxygenase